MSLDGGTGMRSGTAVECRRPRHVSTVTIGKVDLIGQGTTECGKEAWLWRIQTKTARLLGPFTYQYSSRERAKTRDDIRDDSSRSVEASSVELRIVRVQRQAVGERRQVVVE